MQVQGKQERIPYTRSFAVGEALCFLEDQILKDPAALYTEGRFWSAEQPEEVARDLGRWNEKVRDWVLEPGPIDVLKEGFVRIVVTADHKATAEALERRELWGENNTRIEAIDAGDRSCPSWGRHVESEFGPSAFDYGFGPWCGAP
jgi:hypothetical protein